jgi:hypothetical protein
MDWAQICQILEEEKLSFGFWKNQQQGKAVTIGLEMIRKI